MAANESHETPVSREGSEQTPHSFVKDQLKGISFVKEGGKRETLRQRLGDLLYPDYERHVIAYFDFLRATEGSGLPSLHEEDATKRTEIIFRDWSYEQKKAKTRYGELDVDVNEDDSVEDEEVNALEEEQILINRHLPDLGEVPDADHKRITEDDYSDQSRP